jgi:hypothetical protein
MRNIITLLHGSKPPDISNERLNLLNYQDVL